MERLWPLLSAALDRLIAPRTVILRNDTSARAQEGLKEETRLVKGEAAGPVELRENDTRFLADPRAPLRPLGPAHQHVAARHRRSVSTGDRKFFPVPNRHDPPVNLRILTPLKQRSGRG